MPFYWLRYRIGSRASSGDWQWKPIGLLNTEQEAKEEAKEKIYYIDQHENYNDDAGRIKYTVLDWAPTRVLWRYLQSAEEAVKKASDDVKTYEMLIAWNENRECLQCAGAEAGRHTTTKPGEYRRVRGCPTCGREVFEDTLPYLLPPEQLVALKLLGVLVEGGRQPEYNEEWPIECDVQDESGISPLQWLISLGLAGGEASSKTGFKTYYEASDKGALEWEKWGHRLRGKKFRRFRKKKVNP